MAIKTINHVMAKDNGETNEIICPVCLQAVSIRLFETSDASGLTYLLDKEHTTDFAVCPKCASVFSVSENFLKEYKNGTTCFLTADDLTLLRKGNNK